MNPEEHDTPNPRSSVEKYFWISRSEWDRDPGACALKLGALSVAVMAVGNFAPVVALGAALVVIGKAVRS